MTLRRKTIVIITATLAGLLLILFAISQGILLSSFSHLEVNETSQDVQRASAALSDDISNLDAVVGDWAPWDDTYFFVQDLNNSYIENNLNDNTFANLRVNLMLFVNSSGQIVFGKAFDLQNNQEIPVPETLMEDISANNLLTYHASADSKVSGLILLPEGPMLIASQPIMTSQNEGPIRGALIMGRFLDAAEIERLGETTSLSLTVQRLDEPQMPRDFEAARSSLSGQAPIFVRPLDKESVAGYTLLNDVYGEPIMMLRVDVPRVIYQQGQASQLYFIASILGIGVVFGLMVLLVLGKLVLSPLSRLSAAVSNIGKTGAVTIRVPTAGKDELSSLSSDINRMLESLERSHDELRESEETFKHLVEDMNDGYFVVQNSRIVFANTRSAEMFGHSAEEVTGKTVEEFLTPIEVKVLSEWYERRLRGEAIPQQYETTLTRNDGTVVTVEFGARRMYYAGKPAVSVVMRDITRRRHIEEALRESEAKYREVVERANDVVAIVQDTIIKYINKRSSEMLGYQPEEMIGTPVTEYVHPDELRQVISGYERWMSGDTARSVYETALLHKNGNRVDIELNAGVITYEGRPADLVIVRDITERRKALQALRQSEEHYSTLVGSLTDAVFKSKGKLITWCNDRVEGIYGYKRDELIGKEAAFLFPEGVSSSKFAAEVAGAIRNRGYFRSTHSVKRKDGSLVDVEYTISQIHDTEPIELVSVARDITERAQMEKALRQSEEKFRNVLDNSLDMIYSLNLQTGKYEYVSPASKNLLGYSPEEFQALNQDELTCLVHPDDGEKLQQNIIDLITQKGSQALSFEYRVKHKELGYRWVSDNRSAVYDDANMPVSIVGSLEDITESKLTQEALRQREQDYLTLLESTHDSIVVVDAETLKVVYGNRRASLMFGFDPVLQDGIGADLLDFIHPEDRDQAIKGFAEDLYQSERRKRYDIRVKTKDGREILISALGTRIEFRGKIAVLLSLKDVTEIRRAEEKLKQTMTELARSNTELERFAYVASHDLQEPLRMVASYTQLLSRRYKGKLDSDADEFIGYAVDGATRMQQLINALLDYSRIGTRGKPFGPTSCEEIFDQAMANLQSAIKETDAVVTHDYLPTVMSDATQMVQLFQNLIGNAIKFHSEKKPEVHIGAERNGIEWIFSVRDNGIGIDPQYFDRIFVIFQRLHSRAEYPGTGIGLAICKKIIERHKGRIWVESQPGNGATFYFTIPNGKEEKS